MVVTRKQRFNAAQTVPLQAGKHVKTPDELEELVTLVVLNPALGAFIDTLDVHLRTGFSMATLRRSFIYTPHLTDLILIVPGVRSSGLLRGVHLPQLQFFRTDLPHHVIIDFVASHPTLTDLDLLNDRFESPMRCALQQAKLDQLQCLSGPGACVSKLATSGLPRLTMQRSKSAIRASLWMRTIPAPLPVLYQLTIDVCDDDDDILTYIARVCPALRKLKILEHTSTPRRRPINRRPWNDRLAWSKALKRLPLLEELLLRTTAPLVRSSGSLPLERKVILTWVHGRGGVKPLVSAKAHPMLYHIGVWYDARKLDGGCITHWSKPSGVWARTAFIANPQTDHPFI